MKKLYLSILLLFVLLSGCMYPDVDIEEAIFYATQNAEYGVVPPPKYQTLAATAYNLRLTSTPMGTATPDPNYSPTPNAFQYAQTADVMVQSNQMTQQAQQYQYEMQKLEAERAAQAAKETAQVHSMNMTAFAQATQVQATAFAEGTQVMSTAYAQATATERAYMLNSQASSTAYVMTQAMQPTSDIMTMQAARIQQTIEAGEAEKVELAVKRQQAKNYFDAYLPWALILGLAYVFGRGFSTYVRQRMHTRDEHGRKQSVTRELPDGGMVHIDTEKLETAIVKVTRDGDVIRYEPMDKEEQSDINRRAQAIEAIAALPVPYAKQGTQLMTSEFGKTKPRLKFHDGNSMSPVWDEADSQFLEGSHE